ncbi:MAG: hypothetical protein HPY45_13305 [Anaerolineae bacterium]|nr:hypothetical protein [Anaerolineae bacterium]
MARARQRILYIVLILGALLGFPCLGVAGGVAMFALESTGQFAKWQSLGAPPEKAVTICGGDTSTVYVATQANRIYGCQHRGEQTNCWFVVEDLPEADSRIERDAPVFQGQVEPPSGTVISQLNVTQRRAETADETRYALLADGTVWQWEYSRMGWVALAGNLLVGFVGGATIGIPLAVIVALIGAGIALARRWRRRKQRDV